MPSPSQGFPPGPVIGDMENPGGAPGGNPLFLNPIDEINQQTRGQQSDEEAAGGMVPGQPGEPIIANPQTALWPNDVGIRQAWPEDLAALGFTADGRNALNKEIADLANQIPSDVWADALRSVQAEDVPGWSPAEQVAGRGPYEPFTEIGAPYMPAEQLMAVRAGGEFERGPDFPDRAPVSEGAVERTELPNVDANPVTPVEGSPIEPLPGPPVLQADALQKAIDVLPSLTPEQYGLYTEFLKEFGGTPPANLSAAPSENIEDRRVTEGGWEQANQPPPGPMLDTTRDRAMADILADKADTAFGVDWDKAIREGPEKDLTGFTADEAQREGGLTADEAQREGGRTPEEQAIVDAANGIKPEDVRAAIEALSAPEEPETPQPATEAPRQAQLSAEVSAAIDQAAEVALQSLGRAAPSPPGAPMPADQRALQTFERHQERYERTLSPADLAQSRQYPVPADIKQALMAGKMNALEAMSKISGYPESMIQQFRPEIVAGFQARIDAARADVARQTAAEKSSQQEYQAAREAYERQLWEGYLAAQVGAPVVGERTIPPMTVTGPSAPSGAPYPPGVHEMPPTAPSSPPADVVQSGGAAPSAAGAAPTPPVAHGAAQTISAEISYFAQLLGVPYEVAADLVFRMRGMAGGGRPKKGEPVVVGERGPEVFIPDQRGTVVPYDMPPPPPDVPALYLQLGISDIPQFTGRPGNFTPDVGPVSRGHCIDRYLNGGRSCGRLRTRHVLQWATLRAAGWARLWGAIWA